jgi:hypothetical protein
MKWTWQPLIPYAPREPPHIPDSTWSGLDEQNMGPCPGMWLGAAQAARRLHRPHQLSRLAWDKSRLSKQIGRMAARGLVERKGFATDARGAVAALTKTGRDAIASANPVQSAGVRKWFISALAPEQFDAIIEISTAVTDKLARRDPELSE